MNRISFLFVGVGCLIAFAVFCLFNKPKPKITFLNVGQGDAIFIRTPQNQKILIDTGDGKNILTELNKVLPFYETSIDIVLTTHPDADHVGGVPAVLNKYKVGTYVYNGQTNTTVIFHEIEKILKQKSIPTLVARRGMVFGFSSNCDLEVLFPFLNVSKLETNEASIMSLLNCQSLKVMLTGDASVKDEKLLIAFGKPSLDADILKVGHHGSKTSTSEEFLATTTPQIAIISVGKNNKYGHPNAEVVDRIKSQKIKTLLTMDAGTISFDLRSLEQTQN